MKSILSSKTVWYAILTGVASTIALLATSYPEVAALGIANSLAVFVLRIVTTEAIQ